MTYNPNQRPPAAPTDPYAPVSRDELLHVQALTVQLERHITYLSGQLVRQSPPARSEAMWLRAIIQLLGILGSVLDEAALRKIDGGVA